MKLLIFDLDGTLFNTNDINYFSYKEALGESGFNIDYDFFRYQCYGKHFTDFLSSIVGNDPVMLKYIHNRKKDLYLKYIDKAIPNTNLFGLLETAKSNYSIALVTTASKKNTYDILCSFEKQNLFDLILTQEDISKPKPDPEGFKKAIQYFNAEAKETIIFEDSESGIVAAKMTGATVIKVIGFH